MAQDQDSAVASLEPVLLTMPYLHPSINDWRRWTFQKRAREVSDWRTRVWAHSKKQSPFDVRVDVYVTYFFATIMNRDNDNFTPKFIMDAMCGIYIHDDDSRHVRRTIIELGYSVENPRTEIWVVPVQPVELIERPVVRKDARPSLVGKRLGRGFGRMVR